MSPPSSKPKAVDPRRLSQFIDSPSVGNMARVKHSAEIKGETRVVSWDGAKCDVRPVDSRLAPPDHAVVPSDRRAPRLLATTDSSVPASGLLVSKHVPVRSDAGPGGGNTNMTAPVMVQREGFGRGPEIAHEMVPASVFLHEQGLLTPAQRRERLQFETKYQDARRAMSQAERDERRLHQIVQGRHVTNDVLNMDPLNARGSVAVRGVPFKPELLAHRAAPVSQLPREYQKKVDAATPQLNTHDRIFNKTPMPWSKERAQKLRNEGQAGRPFDVVNGGVVAHFPPTIAEKQHPRQSHPSVMAHPYTR